MSLDTYANLQTAIADHLGRDDLTDQIPDFILLAEEAHRAPVKEGGIRAHELMSREAIAVDARQVAFPTGFLEVVSFRLLTNPVTELEYVNYHEMNRVRSEASGKPSRFTIGPEFEFDRTPDSSYSGEIVCFKEAAALSDSNESNEILANYPAAYLYGALVATSPYLMDDPRIVVWQTLYAKAASRANSLASKMRRGRGVSRVAGPTP